MFVGKVVFDQIDVIFLLESFEHIQEVGTLQLGQSYLAWPGSVYRVVDAGNNGLDVSSVKLFVVVEELEARVRVHDVLFF